METLKALYLRRTVRRFTSRKIPERTLLRILDAGNQAPKPGNLQELRFIVVTDEALKKKVADAAAHQMWLADASALVIICSITRIIKRHFGKRAELYSIQQSSLSAQNIMTAATGLNVGSAFVSAFAEKTLRRHLSIADDADPHMIIALGYPERMPRSPVRKPLGEICFFDSYGNKSTEKSIYPIGDKLKLKK